MTPRLDAVALPQFAGSKCAGGSVLYLCAGTSERSRPCGKLLFVWARPVLIPGDYGAEHGAVEIKCRRCKSLNVAALSSEEKM